MFEKLKEIEKRYRDIEEALADPGLMSDNERGAKLLKEYKSLTPVIEKYREWIRAKDDLDAAKELMTTESDAEMRSLAEEEYYSCRDKLPSIEDELKILLLPKDD